MWTKHGGPKGVITLFSEYLLSNRTNLWGRVNSELQLGFLAIIHTQSFQEKRSESRSSATSEGMKYEESLETSALIC